GYNARTAGRRQSGRRFPTSRVMDMPPLVDLRRLRWLLLLGVALLVVASDRPLTAQDKTKPPAKVTEVEEKPVPGKGKVAVPQIDKDDPPAKAGKSAKAPAPALAGGLVAPPGT